MGIVESFIVEWQKSFGDSHVHPRDVLDAALSTDHLALLLALRQVLPETARHHPHPRALSRWLIDNENKIIANGSGAYRLRRRGQRWQLLRVPDEVLAAE